MLDESLDAVMRKDVRLVSGVQLSGFVRERVAEDGVKAGGRDRLLNMSEADTPRSSVTDSKVPQFRS